MLQLENELKGTTFTLSVLHIHNADPLQVQQMLSAKVAEAPQFFKGAPIVLNVEYLTQVPDFLALKVAVEAAEFVLVGITGVKTEPLRSAAQNAGLAILRSGKSLPTLATPTKVHVGHLRSGQQLYAPNSSLVIIGSVNHGAEVIADESIHIYGALYGRALAGVKGNRQARIYCQHLEAELVSIATIFQLSEAIPEALFKKPAQIWLQEEQLCFDHLIHLKNER